MILTLHDLGSNHRSVAQFCSLTCMRSVTERSLLVHICVPGQETGAEVADTVPSLQVTVRISFLWKYMYLVSVIPNITTFTQDLSTSVLAVMELLQLEQVVILGVGAGANIATRVALAAPNKVIHDPSLDISFDGIV